jgi:hypothetical protein
MRDYYDILELPISATPEQIKAKYRQLVRIYHPDRFTNIGDKSFAEQKLKELNEAYSALSALARAYTAQAPNRPLPIPLIEPPSLNFGLLHPQERATARFQVRNAGAIAQTISLNVDHTQRWFTVTRGQQTSADQQAPIEYEVVANTDALMGGQYYQSWIEVSMDGISTRLDVALKVAEQQSMLRTLPRWIFAVLVATPLLFAGIVALPLLAPFADLLTPQAHTQTTAGPTTHLPGVASPASAPQSASVPMVDTSADSSTSWSPIFSPDGQQIAFLSDQLGAAQIYLRDPQSGRIRPLTATPDAKSAPAWSPDSARLAFIAEQGASSVVQVLDVKSGTLITLAPTNANGRVQRFAWSAEGGSITLAYVIGGEITYYQAGVPSGELQIVARPADW